MKLDLKATVKKDKRTGALTITLSNGAVVLDRLRLSRFSVGKNWEAHGIDLWSARGDAEPAYHMRTYRLKNEV